MCFDKCISTPTCVIDALEGTNNVNKTLLNTLLKDNQYLC